MTGITARIFSQIILMIALGAVPGRGGLDGRSNRTLPLPRRLNARYHSLRRFLLLRRLRKNRRSILSADVIALTVEGGRIMQFEEPLLEYIFVAKVRRIESYTDRFRVSRFAVVCIGVSRILEPAPCVADLCINHARHVAENFLDTPETTARKHGHLRLFSARTRREVRSVLVIHDRFSLVHTSTNFSRFVSALQRPAASTFVP